jgi:hypothetical protein
MSRTFLLADSADHAEILDQFIAARLRDVDGSKCSQWSGVWTDGERFGVLWAAPASGLFGSPVTEETPDGDPSLVLATEVISEVDGELVSDWYELPPPEPAAEEIL